MVEDTVTIATSIAPKGIERQVKAVSSWIAYGFNVISINNPDEILVLQEHFPSVRFMTAPRNGKEKVGIPLVFLADIFSSLREVGSNICGIVNSDIVLCPPDGLVDFIRAEAKGCLLYGSRVEIENTENLVGEEYSGGFDYFFFDRSLIEAYPVTQFCMGAPWWDYWMCFTPLICNIPVKKLSTRIAFHERHDKNWSYEIWLRYCKHFVAIVIFKGGGLAKYPAIVINMLFQLLTKNYGTFAEDIVKVINRESVMLTLSGERSRML